MVSDNQAPSLNKGEITVSSDLALSIIISEIGMWPISYSFFLYHIKIIREYCQVYRINYKGIIKITQNHLQIIYLQNFGYCYTLCSVYIQPFLLKTCTYLYILPLLFISIVGKYSTLLYNRFLVLHIHYLFKNNIYCLRLI